MYNPGSGSGSKLGQTPRSGSGIQIQCIWIHITGWNELKEYHSEFLLFHLRWSRSRTFKPASAKMSRLLLRNTEYTGCQNSPTESATLTPLTFSADWDLLAPFPCLLLGLLRLLVRRLVPVPARSSWPRRLSGWVSHSSSEEALYTERRDEYY